MWKRTNLEDAHENPLVSSQITCLKTRLRFVDKILFFQFNCSCLKKNSNTFWPTYRLYQLVLICVLILHIKINMFWIITVVFLCLASLSIFERQVDFCVFTIKNNIEELKKTKTWRKTPWSGSVGEVLLQLRMPGVFFPCLPGVKPLLSIWVNFGSWKKPFLGPFFFRSTFVGKGRATVGKSQYLILLPLDCVCSTSCIGEAWRQTTQKEDGLRQTNEVCGVVGWFFFDIEILCWLKTRTKI